MTAILNIIYYFFLFIDCVVYWLISIAYRVFLLVSQASFYNSGNDKIEALSNRIYVILGVAMLFILAYNIILLIMNPDKFGSNGDKSIQGLLKNLVISVVIITFLPTIFSWMNVLQNNILENQVIERVILGYTADNGDESAIIDTKNMGNKISTLIFSTFYHPVDDNGNVITYSDCKSPNLATDAKKICDKYVSIYESAESSGSFFGFMDRALMNELTTGLTNSVANMQYIVLASSVIGVVCLFMFVSYAIDIGIRVAKLTFLQIIAPVPVILRITKPSGGIFSKWLNMIIETYTSLFMRLITIYFSVFTVNLIADGFMSASGGLFGQSKETNGLIILFGYLFVIVGVLLFAKEAPELIKSFTGGKGGGGFGLKDIKKKFTDAGNVAKSVPIAGSAIQGAEKGISKTYGAATGALGAMSTALQNKKRGASVTDALKQGAWNGFKAGGRQFGAQRGKAFTDIYGYGKKQGVLGGISLEDRLNEKYGKLMNKNLKENAKKANDEYLDNKLGDQIPKDNVGIVEAANRFNSANTNFANNSSSYKEARDYVDNEARKANVQLTSDERNARINERLANMAQTTTNEKEKRSINTYLKRDAVIKSYQQSAVSGNVNAVQTLKHNAKQITRANVEAQIKRNGVENVITDQNVKSQINSFINEQFSLSGNDINKMGFSDKQLENIERKSNEALDNKIKSNGGSVSNIQLTPEVASKVQISIEKKVNDKMASMGNISNVDDVKKQLTDQFKEETIKEVLKQNYEVSYAKDEMKNQMVSDYLFHEQYDAVEQSLRNKEEQSLKEQFKEYAEGLANGNYTREESGNKDKAFDQTFKDNEKISKDGVKTKSAADEVWDNFKKWHDEQKK